MKIAGPNYIIRRTASARNGYTRKEDRLPKRLQEALLVRPAKSHRSCVVLCRDFVERQRDALGIKE